MLKAVSRSLFSFSGRTDKNVWYVWLGVSAMGFWLLTWLCGVGRSPGPSAIQSGVVLLVGALLAVNWLAITVRRLHDSNHSGWWLLSFATVIGMIPLVYWLIIDGGTHGGNRFGEDPAKRQPKAGKVAAEPAVETPATTSSPDAVSDLKRLAKLRDEGVLTEVEFAAQKERLLKAV